MLLAELNIRHTRRHMPTRRVAVDDGYLPTNGAGVRRRAHRRGRRRARARARRGAVRRARPPRRRRPPRAHGAAHRAALPTAEPTPTGSTSRATASSGPDGRTGLDQPDARARPSRPRRAAGDRRDHGGVAAPAVGRRIVLAVRRRRHRPPGRAARGARGPPALRRAPRACARRSRAPTTGGWNRPRRPGARVARHPVGAAVGDGGARAPRGLAIERDDVQRRFRRLVRLAHPDHGAGSAGAAERIAELSEARGAAPGVIASAGAGRAG